MLINEDDLLKLCMDVYSETPVKINPHAIGTYIIKRINELKDSAIVLNEFYGQKETLMMWDRTRTVVYNGGELQMNSYSCSSCKSDYKFEEQSHKFCPFCGTKYKFEMDVSI